MKDTPLLACPPTVTTTSPVAAPDGTVTVIEVSLQLVAVAVAATPLKVIVPVPCVAPKFSPKTVTDVPSGPVSGFNEMIAATMTTVKATLLLVWPSAVTTTLPEVAFAGTSTVIDVSLQLV